MTCSCYALASVSSSVPGSGFVTVVVVDSGDWFASLAVMSDGGCPDSVE